MLDQQQRLKAARIVYHRWASQYTRKKQWKEAVKVYEAALKQHPGDKHFTNHAVAVWNSWAGPHINAKEWSEAIEVYDRALRAFPDNGTLKNNRKYCRQQLNDGNTRQ